MNLRSLFPGIVNSQQRIIHLATLFINPVLLSLSDFIKNSFETKMGIRNLAVESFHFTFEIFEAQMVSTSF